MVRARWLAAHGEARSRRYFAGEQLPARIVARVRRPRALRDPYRED